MIRLFFLLLPFYACVAHAECPSLDIKQLDALVEKEGGKHLVFFSTWCSDCKEHVKSTSSEKTIFIVTFDKSKRAEVLLRNLGRTEPCYLDNGLAKKFLVRVVPSERNVSKD